MSQQMALGRGAALPSSGSPLKPWERSAVPNAVPGVVGGLSAAAPSPLSSMLAPSAGASLLAPQSAMSLGSASSLTPTMPGAFGASPFGFRPGGLTNRGVWGGSRFGSSPFGASYSSPFRPSMYGGMSAYGGGLGLGGVGDQAMANVGGWQPLERSLGWMQYLMDTISRFSYLLSANFEAMNGSFTSFLGFYEVLEPVIAIIQGLTIFKIVRTMLSEFLNFSKWILIGSAPRTDNPKTLEDSWSGQKEQTTDASQSQNNVPTRNPLLDVLSRATFGVALVMCLPLAVRMLKKLLHTQSHGSNRTAARLEPGQVVEVLHGLQPQSPKQLTLVTGELLRVIDPQPIPNNADWVTCESTHTGQSGFVPRSFIRTNAPTPTPTPTPTTTSTTTTTTQEQQNSS
ncbi:peroxin-13 [Pelomyxa schiedti]|nr:peroxin-13 [Pelomyxa schiedti]